MKIEQVYRVVETKTTELYNVLYRLGVTAKYRGFFYTSYAVSLAVKQPDRLLMVTKWLYPEVARQFQTTWSCVERNIRTVTNLAWKNNREYLEELAHMPLTRKPTPTQFLAILADYISSNDAA